MMRFAMWCARRAAVSGDAASRRAGPGALNVFVSAGVLARRGTTILRALGALLVVLLCVNRSDAQEWDPVGAKEVVAGLPSELTTGSILVVHNDTLYFVDYDGQAYMTPVELGTAKVVYRFPLTWAEEHTHTFFADDPSSSPTGYPISATVESEAVAYEVHLQNYEGYVVGLLVNVRAVSGPTDDNRMYVFLPGALPTDEADAKRYLIPFTTGDPLPAPECPPPQTRSQTCVVGCQNTLRADILAARDTYNTNKRNCWWWALSGAGAGCGIAGGVCFFTGPGVGVCCVFGALGGGALGYWACLDNAYHQFVDAVNDANRRYQNCMVGCCSHSQ